MAIVWNVEVIINLCTDRAKHAFLDQPRLAKSSPHRTVREVGYGYFKLPCTRFVCECGHQTEDSFTKWGPPVWKEKDMVAVVQNTNMNNVIEFNYPGNFPGNFSLFFFFFFPNILVRLKEKL